MPTSAVEERARRLSSEPLEVIGQHRSFFRGGAQSARELWQRRDLLNLLVRRELKARYKGSSLGVVWSLIRPLAQLLIYYFAIGQILGAARNVPSFAIFVFVGLTVWTLFTEILGAGTTSIIGNEGLIKKVYLPREIFPMSTVGGALFNFGVQLIVLIAATLVVLQPPILANLGSAVLALLVIVVFGTGLILLLSAINVYLRDVQHFVEVAIIVLFWASPIVYPFNFVSDKLHGNWLEQIYLANPITLAVLGMQKAFWEAGTTDPLHRQFWPADLDLRLAIALVASFVFMWIMQRIFARLQGNFAQEL